MICGHMRTLGPDRILHVCIKTFIVHEDEHLLIPWREYSDSFTRDSSTRGRELPDWFTSLAGQAKQLERAEFIKALSEDPDEPEKRPPLPDPSDPDSVKSDKWRAREEYAKRHPDSPGQCTVTVIDGQDVLRCLRQAGHDPELHPHGPWGKVGEVPPVPPLPRLDGDPDLKPGYVPPDDPEGYSLGRSQTPLWQEVTQLPPEPGNEPDQGGGADAWKSPDDGGRAAAPPEGGVPDADLGYSVSGRGKLPILDLKFDYPGDSGGGTGGSSMASVAEVKAALDGVIHSIGEAQGLIHATVEKIGTAEGQALAAAEGSGHDSISTGNSFLAQAKADVEGALQTLQAAIESYGQYSATL